MRKAHLHLIYIILTSILLAGSLSSCGKKTPKGAVRSVLVIHSWDSTGEEGAFFTECMAEAFRKENINADIHHIYANMLHRSPEQLSEVDWPRYADSISLWKPEIILLNDDPILRWVLRQHVADSLFSRVPVVFAGINVLMRDSLQRFPMMTGYCNNLNLPRCMEMLLAITDSQIANIELDHNDHDDVLRHKFYGQISDSTRFINNADHRMDDVDNQFMAKNYPAKVLINFTSCASPETNCKEGEPASQGKLNLTKAYLNAKNTWQVQVKYDIFSDAIIDRTHVPQFTCIRQQFNDPQHLKFLGGYFTSTETQVKDQVGYAAKILSGTSPGALPIATHESGCYLDYNAMQKLKPELKYDLVAEKYNVINAPMALKQPMKYLGIIALIALFASGLVAILGQLLYLWRKRAQNAILDSLVYEEKMHNLIFSDGNDTLWHRNEETLSVNKKYAQKHGLPSTNIPMKNFRQMVHPDSLTSLDTLNDFRQQRGKRVVRLRLTFDEGKTWSWYEMTYTATDESAKTGDLYGIMLNIDRKKEIEDTLLQAQIKASEVALKENFFANISHDLRNPLNAITGFSTLLTSSNMTFAPGEREEYGKIIHQNTELILNMINSVVEKAQLESGDIQLIQKPVSVKELIANTYASNKILAPDRLQFLLETAPNDATINIDINRTIQVINNFINNSFKFTETGSVTLGWKTISDTDEIEIYVRDTGCGISEEHQQKLFDRYYKENEADKGTGLGLNISKTIINKQGGTIGVKSKAGKGSTFYFRIPRYIQMLLLILCTGWLTTSCTGRDAGGFKKSNVLVIHGYSSDFPSYKTFDEKIASTLRRQNIDADIRNIYLQLENPLASGRENFLRVADSLKRIGWKADLILSEGDRTAYDISRYRLDDILPYAENTPIVFGSLHHPNWNFLREHKNTVVFYDPIDYTTNINLATELTGINIIAIELDYFQQDSIIREELLRSIARPPYVCNSRYFPANYDLSNIAPQYKDSILVYTISVESPERNTKTTALAPSAGNLTTAKTDSRNTENQPYLRNIYMNAWSFPHLAVKRDMYSKEIPNKTHRPQFTAVKAGFADGSGAYLAGYFADYNTVATDIAQAGAKLLWGASPKDLSGKQHEKHYYMDYKAMQQLGYRYHDYADRFYIVGAPPRYTSPWSYYTLRVTLILFAIFVAFVWLTLMNFLRERTSQHLLHDVRRKANLRNLALNGADSRQIRNEAEMQNTLQHIHPDHREPVPLIQQSLKIAGAHQYEIFADIDEDGTYEWWQLRFFIQPTTKNRTTVQPQNNKTTKQQNRTTAGPQVRIDGLAININATKQNEEKLRTAIRLAEEAKQKEDFLMTISHEIRTPLNAVVGFSDVIITLPPEALTPDELTEFSQLISENNKKLATMIEDILMFSRIESGRLQFVKSEFYADEIIEEIAHEWKDKIPQGVEFIVTNHRHHIQLHTDRQRLKYILDQLLSNAVKFTTSGTITLTLRYHYNSSEAEIIVEDTGCGISPEKQRAAFNLFWKNNEFVPGLGLGLNIASRLADGMDAHLQVDSREGFGSTFSLLMQAEFKKR
ncbi:MAG: HAMP domain-containing histidine kinase [Bacteroidaceae bacterium]|nr:HAMP domain-containing histidine kinase [Bacteroidaceae bacterium]